MNIANTIALLGGLAFFLFGMSLLGEGLKRVAGSKLEIILAKLTSTTFKGVLLGSLVTAVIQSSSATAVMVVGFVNSGIMKLANAMASSRARTLVPQQPAGYWCLPVWKATAVFLPQLYLPLLHSSALSSISSVKNSPQRILA